eukprot:1197897-Pyramimonas_sp.AAC.1
MLAIPSDHGTRAARIRALLIVLIEFVSPPPGPHNSVRGVSSSTLGAKSPTSYNKPPQRQHVPQDAFDNVSFDRPCSIPRGEPT